MVKEKIRKKITNFTFNWLFAYFELQIFSQLPHMTEQKHQALKADFEPFGDKDHLNSSSSSEEQHSSTEGNDSC